MRDRPEEMAEPELVRALTVGWGITARTLTYLPVGAGSYHWSVTDGRGSWFVTVDDLGYDPPGRDTAFDALGRALDTALALRREAALDFVVAPVPARCGATLRRVNPRHAVAVFPMLDGRAGRFGPHPPEHRVEVTDLLIRLHGATPAVAAVAPRAELALPGRYALRQALDDLDRQWTSGPFAEPARRLLAARAEHVERRLGEFDRLAERVGASGGDWVITHGEPHPGNMVRCPDGLRLVDWDTVRLAPPERDLWLVADGPDDEVLSRYHRATGRVVDPDGLALYRLRWELADIAGFVEELRRPHRATADATASWTYLKSYLS